MLAYSQQVSSQSDLEIFSNVTFNKTDSFRLILMYLLLKFVLAGSSTVQLSMKGRGYISSDRLMKMWQKSRRFVGLSAGSMVFIF